VPPNPVVVIGAGVIGCAVAWELTRRAVPVVLVEAQPDVCEGTSKANSAILHTGFDSKPGSVESAMLRRAAELWPEVLEDLHVPFLRSGALMLARTADDAGRLETEVQANASALGVVTEILAGPIVHEIAPYLARDVVAALSIPDEAILDPFWLTRAFAEAAISGGATLRTRSRVVGLEFRAADVLVTLTDGATVSASQVVDAAGLRADEVARLVGDESFTISPRKGQFLVSEETFGVDRIVLPIPGPLGKGMLVTPIVFGGLLLGPTAVDTTDKTDRSTDSSEADRIVASCQTMVPAVGRAAPIRQFAGLRHVSSTGEFIVRPSTVDDRLFFAAGIRSTGVSTSVAVAEVVANQVSELRGWSRPGPKRRLEPRLVEFAAEAGEVVCICRSIARAELEAACRQSPPPETLDAVKRRSGAGFGDCQGNLCALAVSRVLAEERGTSVESLEKHEPGSWLWLGDADAATPPTGDVDGVDSERWDAVVVGGGRAGTAAARAMSARGLRVLVVDRERPLYRASGQVDPLPWLAATVVGLSATGSGWSVLAQAAAASWDVACDSVILATGAYVEPREHRAIAGPRPAGVMTSDLALRLLEAGLLPGRAIALVGGLPEAGPLAEKLQRLGAQVTWVEAPDALRGGARLEAVRVAGEWLSVDTLILADRRIPQAFLLRALGLLDARPGRPTPVDGDGRVTPDGLWAAGCCVAPDGSHVACAASGERVGIAVTNALATNRPRAAVRQP
jgi:glycerol-3-phosphate dehydrogenase